MYNMYMYSASPLKFEYLAVDSHKGGVLGF